MHGNNKSKNHFLGFVATLGFVIWFLEVPPHFLPWFCDSLMHDDLMSKRFFLLLCGSATTWCMGIWCPKGFFCSFVVLLVMHGNSTFKLISFVWFCSCIWHFLSFINAFLFYGALVNAWGQQTTSIMTILVAIWCVEAKANSPFVLMW